MTETGRIIIESLQKDEWEQGEYTITHIKTGIQIWTENMPILDIEVYNPKGVKLSLHDKYLIWRAIKKVNNVAIVKALKGVE